MRNKQIAPATNARFTLTIDCSNAAFEDAPQFEVAAILRKISYRLESEGPQGFSTYQTLFDTNGNDVGRAKLFAEGQV